MATAPRPQPQPRPTTPVTPATRDELLDRVQRRVLWLATHIIHYANRVRPNLDGTKVGGHQASSASLVTVMTALYFDFLRAGDRVSVKPHASPVFHAIQYLLGQLDRAYLPTLRAFHGLQAYPSRTKDPDPVDFSTGSVGLGAVAPNFAALVDRYTRVHFGTPGTPGRYVALVGDAELDEGSIWEAVAEPALHGVHNVLWLIDLNRQSLDRVVPGIRARQWKQMFAVNGWQVIDVKYGHRLQDAFSRPGGELLRERIDEMPNEEYQRLLRVPGELLRAKLITGSRDPAGLRQLLAAWGDEELPALYSNLGGHDLAALREAFAEADAAEQPVALFAYTIKGWGLPIAGDPLNHSAALSDEQVAQLRVELGIPAGDGWDAFPAGSDEAALCAEAAERLRQETPPPPLPALEIPTALGSHSRGNLSTQDALGRILTDLAREAPEVARRVVTTSPDVATSTNLGGWINKVGVFSVREHEDFFADAGPRLLRWTESPRGQHIELGISENNLFLLLGQLGLSRELCGELLLPLGTLYDPFVCRGLDAFIYGVYSGARFIVVGTPSGVTLSPEGGAHQSLITPSIGLELPGVVAYEPCFARELEWILLEGLRQCTDREQGESLYLRLSTKPVDQALFPLTEGFGEAAERLRRQVLAGGYRLLDYRGVPDYRPGENVVHLVATGVMVPEAVAASRALAEEEGLRVNVLNLTSPDRLYRAYHESLQRALESAGDPPADPFAELIPPAERAAPLVTVLDGHPHTLAWLGGALGMRCHPLGVTSFGQSGTRADLYHAARIDAPAIAAACLVALG